MMFLCGCPHVLLCPHGSSQGLSSFWPLLGYDHLYHVASTRYLRICGKTDYDLREFWSGGALCT